MSLDKSIQHVKQNSAITLIFDKYIDELRYIKVITDALENHNISYENRFYTKNGKSHYSIIIPNCKNTFIYNLELLCYNDSFRFLSHYSIIIPNCKNTFIYFQNLEESSGTISLTFNYMNFSKKVDSEVFPQYFHRIENIDELIRFIEDNSIMKKENNYDGT